jgi:hypothetical protein
VVPRQARLGEHVDDHQMDIARHFAERGLIRCVTSETDLAPLLSARGVPTGVLGRGRGELRAAVSDAVAARPHGRRTALRLG